MGQSGGSGVGSGVSRVDGPAKVTGRVVYAGDVSVPGAVHAVLVQAGIARGTIMGIDTTAAMRVPGAVAVFTHENLPKLQPPPEDFTKSFPAERRAPLSDAAIHYAGQHVALVLAETLEGAQATAALVRVRYREVAATLTLREGLPETYKPEHFATNMEEQLQSERGTAGVATARIEAEYRTPVVTHNPMEPSATVAMWEGDRLTLHDSTRWAQGTQKIVAHMLGVPKERVRVLAPYLGGAFGSKGFLWQHVALVAHAARVCGRPVKLVLARREMFTSTGHRPRTIQNLALGADASGRLTTVTHRTLTETSPVAHFCEPAGMTSRNLYGTPHAVISHAVAPTNLATPCFMRAPGESPGMFALESAIDELAEKAGIDPLEFRQRNLAERDLQADRPWSSKHLDGCYRQGAERFGWARRTPKPRSMTREGKLVGWGMATAAYPARRSPATVQGVLTREGVATFSAATEEAGGATATVVEQIAAQTLGLPVRQVHFELGDSAMGEAPTVGASQTTATIGPAVQAAAEMLRMAVLAMATRDERSTFHGSDPNELQMLNGVIRHQQNDARQEMVSAVLARMPETELKVEASTKLEEEAKKQHTFHSFGVHFVEVVIDRELPEVRVTRWVTVMDCGRVLNRMTARSQILGGVIFGLGMALLEETHYDPRQGVPLNADLAEYLLPTCADTPEIDVSFVEEPDTVFTPLGHRGIGEIGITGTPAAIANAVWHATGIRVRTLPIRMEDLLLSV